MTLERYIGYSAFVIIVLHIFPFGEKLVTTITIVLCVGLLLSATYLRWKRRINQFIDSHEGTMTIPHLFERLEQSAHDETSKHNGAL